MRRVEVDEFATLRTTVFGVSPSEQKMYSNGKLLKFAWRLVILHQLKTCLLSI